MNSANGIPDFQNHYLRHCDINNYLDYLQFKFPKLVTVSTIGFSYEGRSMKSIRISANFNKRPFFKSCDKINKCKSATVMSTGKAAKTTETIIRDRNFTSKRKKNGVKSVILIDGGLHAREWCSISTALYCISQLTENYEQNKMLLANFDFVIVPVINVDGYEYSRLFKKMWRKTRRPIQASCSIGVDCNRNFNINWQAANSQPASYTFRGERPFSEPETKILKYLMHSLRPTFYLTLHSYSKAIMYPNAFTHTLPDNWKSLQDLADAGRLAILKKTGTKFRTGSVASIIKQPAAGGSSDYAYNIAKIPFVITMEISGNNFQPSTSSIKHIIRECWTGIRAMTDFLIMR